MLCCFILPPKALLWYYTTFMQSSLTVLISIVWAFTVVRQNITQLYTEFILSIHMLILYMSVSSHKDHVWTPHPTLVLQNIMTFSLSICDTMDLNDIFLHVFCHTKQCIITYVDMFFLWQFLVPYIMPHTDCFSFLVIIRKATLTVMSLKTLVMLQFLCVIRLTSCMLPTMLLLFSDIACGFVSSLSCHFKTCIRGAWEMSRWSKVLAALEEDLSVVLSTHAGELTAACNVSSVGYSFSSCLHRCLHSPITPTCRHIQIHTIKNKFLNNLHRLSYWVHSISLRIMCDSTQYCITTANTCGL